MAYLVPFLLLCLGSAFEHEQALHAKNFRGESQAFCTMLWLSVYASWACRIAILVYIGVKLSWVATVVMFVAGMLVSGLIAGVLAALVARTPDKFGQVVVSLAAFFVWPISFFAAYVLLPKIA